MTIALFPEPLFRIVGDMGLMMEFGATISPLIHHRIRVMMHILDREKVAGVIEYLPAYRSLTLLYDPLICSCRKLQERLADLYKNAGEITLPEPKVVELPVCYGGAFGPDLDFVAKSHQLGEEEVIHLHSQPDYSIYMLGFSPGFPFLGGLPEPLRTPRLESPRRKVPAGSVGIANDQTGVYPVESPGGWQLIGRTPLKLFDHQRPEPFLFAAGDILRFKPISEEEYRGLAGAFVTP